MSSTSYKKFRQDVWNYWKKNGRHDLPWRKTRDPYRIMVSEVMLQQTQVPRVIEKYRSFLKKFPSVRALAKAPLSEVLKEWSGLGYNRRGKYLHDTAKKIVADHKGRIPTEFVELRALPGMGPYTASAIRVFAHNLPDILIETNVRAVYLHEFFNGRNGISDEQLIPLAHAAAADQDPRKWHSALMDYGTHLKRIHKNPARKSKHHMRQSKFEGSLRQVRGEILRRLVRGSALGSGEKWERALASLERDQLIAQRQGKWRIV